MMNQLRRRRYLTHMADAASRPTPRYIRARHSPSTLGRMNQQRMQCQCVCVCPYFMACLYSFLFLFFFSIYFSVFSLSFVPFFYLFNLIFADPARVVCNWRNKVALWIPLLFLSPPLTFLREKMYFFLFYLFTFNFSIICPSLECVSYSFFHSLSPIFSFLFSLIAVPRAKPIARWHQYRIHRKIPAQWPP